MDSDCPGLRVHGCVRNRAANFDASRNGRRGNNKPTTVMSQTTVTAIVAEDEQADESATVIDLSYFDSAGLVSDPQIVDCTLQNGVATQCAEFVTKYMPDNLKIGPFCPDTIYEEGGIWEWDGDEPGLYRLNEAFFTMLTAQGYTNFTMQRVLSISAIRQGNLLPV